MRIGAYQFAVGSSITDNFHAVCRGIEDAASQNIRLLVFPECALTGYPPRDIKSAVDVNFEELDAVYREIEKMSKKSNMYILVRICFEVRYPEYFRELYRENTALNIILFYDVADSDDIERYELIKSHIRTRAVENVTYTMSVNSIRPYQTAPTGIFDKSGRTINELKRNKENLLIYDFKNIADDFGEKGRRSISDVLTKKIRIRGTVRIGMGGKISV